MRIAQITASNRLATFSAMGFLTVVAIFVGISSDLINIFGTSEEASAKAVEASQTPIQNITVYVDGSIGTLGGDNKGTIIFETAMVNDEDEDTLSHSATNLDTEETTDANSVGSEYPRAKVINHPLVSDDHSATLVEQERRIREAQASN